MIFDPSLEKLDGNHTAFEAVLAPSWKAAWIWYPGQLGAHLNTRIFQKAIRRCTHIGYPGNFRQPVYYAEFRIKGELESDVEAQWSAPVGRVRVRINGREGDITVRRAQIPRGPVELWVAVDLTVSLPCFLFEAAGLSSGPGWEASLDGSAWQTAEFQHLTGCPDRFPDLDIDQHLLLTQYRLIILRQGSLIHGGFRLEPGGEAVLDFFHNELGELEFEACGENRLYLGVGESVEEASDPDPNSAEQYPLAPFQLSSISRSIHTPERCLRYVRFHAEGVAEVKKIAFQARIYPLSYQGWFECDDEQVNAIWKAGAATLHSNIHDGAILDGVKRDALIWMFDQNIDFDGADLVFFDRNIVRNTLAAKTPPSSLKQSDLGILDMRLYYILGFYQDFLVSGDLDFVRQYRRPIQDLLEMVEGLQDSLGFLSARAFAPQAASGGHHSATLEGVDYLNEFGPDWAGKSDRAGEIRPTDIDGGGTPAYIQMFLKWVFEICAFFAGEWGDEPLSRRWQARAARLAETINHEFWDADRSAYINGLTREGLRDERITFYAQAWAILSGTAPEFRWERMVSVLETLHPRPKNVSMSTYWEYLAYLKADRFDLALTGLRRFWGWQLERGLSRFIEDIRIGDDGQEMLAFYNRPYGLSLNHGWTGATAVSILMRGVLGLKILTPGYRKIEIAPRWRVFTHCKLRLPTPVGNLFLEYNRGDKEDIDLPEGMELVLRNHGQSMQISGPGKFSLSHIL